jgi:tetratricopeptide (TPR) repeat protein
MLATLGNDPYRADIHWRLAEIYARQQKPDEVVKQCRMTLEIESKIRAHYLLARALQTQGKLDEALEHYAEVLRRQPDARVHNTVADLLANQGQVQDAIVHYREALRLEPKLLLALNNLAWILATDPDSANRDGKEAVQLAKQACLLADQPVASILDTLAAAYAETGRFREAIDTARKARALAEAAGDGKLADRLRMSLDLYTAGRPCHEERTTAKTPEGQDPKSN